MSELIACLPVCSQSVSSAAMLARKEVKLQESVCVCSSRRHRRGMPSFRRHHDRTHLPAKTEGMVRETLAQTGTHTAHLPLISLFFLPVIPPAFILLLLPYATLTPPTPPPLLFIFTLDSHFHPTLWWSFSSSHCKQMSLSTLCLTFKKKHTLT